MGEVSLLLFDIGGVLLTNGFPREARREASTRFGLDPGLFEQRHESIVDGFEKGEVTLDRYLDVTLEGVPAGFPRQEFRQFILGWSQAHEGALETLRHLSQSGSYTMAVLSNESRELNEERIERFGLRGLFSLFFSSCYTGIRKPDVEAYRLVLGVTQREPGTCLFIDDRPENLEPATRLGMRTLLVQDPERLGEDLANAGIKSTQ